MRGVNAFNIKRWISFGITQLLSFLQYISEITTFIAHFRQNKIASTINDTRQPIDFITR